MLSNATSPTFVTVAPLFNDVNHLMLPMVNCNTCTLFTRRVLCYLPTNGRMMARGPQVDARMKQVDVLHTNWQPLQLARSSVGATITTATAAALSIYSASEPP